MRQAKTSNSLPDCPEFLVLPTGRVAAGPVLDPRPGNRNPLESIDGFLESVSDNRQVAFDEAGWRLKTNQDEQFDPGRAQNLAAMRRWLAASARSIRLADLLIEVENDFAFSTRFHHPGARRSIGAFARASATFTAGVSTAPTPKRDHGPLETVLQRWQLLSDRRAVGTDRPVLCRLAGRPCHGINR